MTDPYRTFAHSVLEQYGQLQRPLIEKFAAPRTERRIGAGVGHPEADKIPLGHVDSIPMCSVFLDLSDFTPRSFWDDPAAVARLAIAVLSQYSQVVSDFGGYVLGLRGDGLFAGFGASGSDPRIDVALALGACAYSLDATESALNDLLEASGHRRVQARAGLDWGQADFARTGTPDSNEINVLGFATNFAAKLEKTANAWEVTVGEGASQYISDALLTTHPKSPKQYQRDGEVRRYSFYDFHWRQITQEAITARRQQAGYPTSLTRAVW